MPSTTNPAVSNSTEGRIVWLDQAKGIGMLIVMLGHAPTPPFLTKTVYSFHIPLFFFLSGYVYNPVKYSRLGVLAKAKVRSLLVPYLFFSALGLAYYFAQHHDGRYLHYTPSKILAGIVLGLRDTSPFNGTLWFLTCLFSTTIFYSLLHRVSRGNPLLAAAISLGIAVPCMLLLPGFRANPRLPFSIDVAAVMTFFFALGVLLRPFLRGRIEFKWWGPALLLQLVATWFNSIPNPYFFQFGNPGLFFVHSLSGILVATALIQRLRGFWTIRAIGENSITFLALHQFYLFPPLSVLIFGIWAAFSDSPPPTLLVAGILVLVSAAIILPLALLLKRKTPFLVGG